MVRTITITGEAYDKIKAIKKESESFSEFFTRIAEEKKGNIRGFFGLLKLSESEIAKERVRWAETRKKLSKELELGINARS